MELHDIRQMATHELEKLYDVHEHLLVALPRMRRQASLPFLAECFQDQFDEAQEHTNRFNKLFGQMGADPARTEDAAFRHIVAELDELEPDKSSPAVVDAKLIDIGRKMNLYQEAGYGTLSDVGEQMRLPQFGQLLHDRLHEVDRAAEKLLNAVPEVVFA